MRIIGCDYHPSWQQIVAIRDGGDGGREVGSWRRERRKSFIGSLPGPALIGMESCGTASGLWRWPRRRARSWIGDAAKIRASEVRQQKNDRRDAALILKLLLEGRFPRIWTPSGEKKDLRQLLIHRHKLVRIRVQVKNELQHLAMNQGCRRRESCGARRARRCCASCR